MSLEYANRGPSLSEGWERSLSAESASSSTIPNSDPSSRLGVFLGILAHTLWFLADEAPGTPRLPQLEALAPSAGWPPLAARTLPWNQTRGERSLRAKGIPPLLWEEGANHRFLPVTRWAIQWRLRILPQLSLLGALPPETKDALRGWAWPTVTTLQWQRLWEQLTSTGPFPNLLPLTLWARRIPLHLDYWTRPDRCGAHAHPRSLYHPPLTWTHLSPRCLTRWTCTGTAARQMARDAIHSLTSLPTFRPSLTTPVGPHRRRHRLGVPASHPPNLPYPHRDRILYIDRPCDDDSDPRDYWGYSLEDEFHRWRRTGVGDPHYVPESYGTAARLEHFRTSLCYPPETRRSQGTPSRETPHDHWRARRIGEASHPGPSSRVPDKPSSEATPESDLPRCPTCYGLLSNDAACAQLHRCPGHPDTLGPDLWQCQYCLCYLPPHEARQVHVQRCRLSLPERWRGTPTMRERNTRKPTELEAGHRGRNDPATRRPGGQIRDGASNPPRDSPAARSQSAVQRQGDIRSYMSNTGSSRPNRREPEPPPAPPHAPVLPFSQQEDPHPPRPVRDDSDAPHIEDDPVRCGVCLDPLNAPLQILGCRHSIHDQCWLARYDPIKCPPACPVCEEPTEAWYLEPHSQGPADVPMWRLATILGAAANLMPEPTRLRWRNDPTWGPLFLCLLDLFRAQGPQWRRERGITTVDTTPAQLPALLRSLSTAEHDPLRTTLDWAEKWVPKEIWARAGTYFHSFHGLTSPQRQQATTALAALAQSDPSAPDSPTSATPPPTAVPPHRSQYKETQAPPAPPIRPDTVMAHQRDTADDLKSGRLRSLSSIPYRWKTY